MDSLITTAARALAAGDPLGALNRVAVRDDAPAKALEAARATLEEHEDQVNAAHARYLAVRRLLLIGRIDEAERMLAELDPTPSPPALRTAHELVVAGIAMRRLRTKAARAALARAGRAARQAGIPALAAEVESACLALNTPAARLIARGEERVLLLEGVEALLASRALVLDACRHVVRDARTVVSLARRSVLFALARALGEAWPGDVPRDVLLARAFGAKLADESHRARCGSKSGGFAGCFGCWPGSARPSEGLHLRRTARARSSCWRRRSMGSVAQCLPSSPTVSRGRVQPWRLRLERVSAPCSGRSTRL